MRMFAVKCPECNAALRVQADAETAKCEYCGTRTIVRVSYLRWGFTPKPRPSAGPSDLPEVTVYPNTNWIVAIGAGFPILLVAVFGVIYIQDSGTRSTSPASTRAIAPRAARRYSGPVKWDGVVPSPAILVDITSDGHVDVIGRARRDGQQRIAAYDGVDGDLLWESADCTAGWDESLARTGLIVAHGDVVVGVRASGHMSGCSLPSGEHLWTSKLDGPPGGWACARGDFEVVIHATGHGWQAVNLPTGRVSRASRPQRQCRKVWTSDRVHGDPDIAVRTHAKGNAKAPGAIGESWNRFGGRTPELELRRAREGPDTTWFALGYAPADTPSLEVVAYKMTSHSRGKPLWVAELGDPMPPASSAAQPFEGPWVLATLQRDKLFVVHRPYNDQAKVTVVDIAAGTVGPKHTYVYGRAYGVTSRGQKVFLSTNRDLLAFDTSESEQRTLFTIEAWHNE